MSIVLSYSVYGNCGAAVENEYRFWYQELGISFVFAYNKSLHAQWLKQQPF